MTANDVRQIRFSRPPIGKRGYNEQQVDDLLDLIEAELTRREQRPSAPGQLSGAVIRETLFGKPGFGKRGYHEDEVDAFLEWAAASLDTAPERAVADPAPVVGPAAPGAQTTLYASANTVQLVIAMVQAESERLASSPEAAAACAAAPAVVIYQVD